ncbi:hypothetical protein P7K49_020848 [Saguinus oedipus]|uniref:Uncharacterized protein n=1 Tax=Saguinus oedipus TaxID=9490 RepID=A0ABQ9UR02_SAGOE|nr:hypothetical protein P7K49_020848 [Saguinus oedipus]
MAKDEDGAYLTNGCNHLLLEVPVRRAASLLGWDSAFILPPSLTPGIRESLDQYKAEAARAAEASCWGPAPASLAQDRRLAAAEAEPMKGEPVVHLYLPQVIVTIPSLGISRGSLSPKPETVPWKLEQKAPQYQSSQQGLANRAELAPEGGMLLLFPSPHSKWLPAPHPRFPFRPPLPTFQPPTSRVHLSRRIGSSPPHRPRPGPQQAFPTPRSRLT